MWKRVTCKKCNSVIEYEDKSIFEGNREREDVQCLICKNIVAHVFTDLIHDVRLVKDGRKSN